MSLNKNVLKKEIIINNELVVVHGGIKIYYQQDQEIQQSKRLT